MSVEPPTTLGENHTDDERDESPDGRVYSEVVEFLPVLRLKRGGDFFLDSRQCRHAYALREHDRFEVTLRQIALRPPKHRSPCWFLGAASVADHEVVFLSTNPRGLLVLGYLLPFAAEPDQDDVDLP